MLSCMFGETLSHHLLENIDAPDIGDRQKRCLVVIILGKRFKRVKRFPSQMRPVRFDFVALDNKHLMALGELAADRINHDPRDLLGDAQGQDNRVVNMDVAQAVGEA